MAGYEAGLLVCGPPRLRGHGEGPEEHKILLILCFPDPQSYSVF